jgi:hypothetical protein
MIRNSPENIWMDISPNSLNNLNIGVRAKNECGCSNWVYKMFQVVPNNGRMTPILDID